MTKQNGIKCPNGNHGLKPLFTYSGINYALTRVDNLAYCDKCNKAFVISFKEV